MLAVQFVILLAVHTLMINHVIDFLKIFVIRTVNFWAASLNAISPFATDVTVAWSVHPYVCVCVYVCIYVCMYVFCHTCASLERRR